jgi:hypothetical protein
MNELTDTSDLFNVVSFLIEKNFHFKLQQKNFLEINHFPLNDNHKYDRQTAAGYFINR